MKINPALQKINQYFLGTYKFLSSLFALFIFISIARLLNTERLSVFDESFLQYLHEILPSWFTFFAKLFYFLGEAEVAIFIVLFSLIFLGWKRYWKEAEVLAASSLTVLILVDKILKPFFNRVRPLDRLVENIHGKSFPSGHATGNLLLYLLLAYMISSYYPEKKFFVYSMAIIFLVLMGISSCYLRVHWITDIVGGFCLGYIMFTIAVVFLRISD
jgi:undecaprenyl-diphosphatase